MRIVPVLDLLNRKVVRGVAGNRAEYAPIESTLSPDPSPASIAQRFASLGFKECYIADLDAIAGADPDYASYQGIIRAGLERIWIDAGTGTLASSVALDERLSSAGGEQSIVIGSESLAGPSDLFALVKPLGSDRLIFSLDLKAGCPIVAAEAWRHAAPLEIARDAIRSGIQRLIVLDLANVGVSSGVGTEQLCRAIRQLDNHIEIIAGGGVRNTDDLRRLADWGCSAALVASALHDGRIAASELSPFLAR
jgi:phosphoribosylformimino-5-aminoimidazole carboxamide ribotide isomerase